MAKTPAAPQVPGEIPPAPPAATAPNPTPPENSAPAGDGDTVAVPKAQLDAILAKVAELEAEVAAAPVARVPKAPADDLPDQAAVNPDTIKSPVLTKQGWVVPTDFGTNPAAKRI